MSSENRVLSPEVARVADHPIESLFLERWSPRAFDESTMPRGEFWSILEAARWAPSAYNLQPWRFLYAFRGDDHWETFLSLLDPFNASWAHRASALVFLVSEQWTESEKGRRLSRVHSLDAGAAWAHLALQATALGYQAHAMAGVHFETARRVLAVPERFHLEMAVALGKRGEASLLPEALSEREKPSPRRPLFESVFAGCFPQE